MSPRSPHVRTMWQCLLSLLADPRYKHSIRWIGTDGAFELTDRDSVAELWAQYSPRSSANPWEQKSASVSIELANATARENLMRVIRWYKGDEKKKRKAIIVKVPGRYRYKFVQPIVELTGYTVAELSQFNACYSEIELSESDRPSTSMN